MRAPQATGTGSTFGEVDGATNYGVFGATDTRTGKVVWRVRVSQPAESSVSVAGDLVFFGESNGGTSIPGGGGANASPSIY